MPPQTKPAIGPDGPAVPELGPERRMVVLEDVEFRGELGGTKDLIVRGHAAVFDRPSLDLGGFTERIAKGAFKEALDANPDVHLLWDHDSSLALARTRSAKYALELREDPRGLHFYAKVAPTSYAKDLAILMDSQVVDQASFAFTVADGGDSWEIDGNEKVTRTINQIGELFDVTITAQGAYPQTDTSVVTHMRTRIAGEIEQGRLPEQARAALKDPEPETDGDVEQDGQALEAEVVDYVVEALKADDPKDEGEATVAAEVEPGGDSSLEAGEQDQQEDRSVAAEDQPGGDSSRQAGEQEERVVTGLRELQTRARVELELAKRRLLEADRK